MSLFDFPRLSFDELLKLLFCTDTRNRKYAANGGQWLIGKCGDGYAPTGPVITTIDEFNLDDDKGGAGDLHIECRLNAETVQSSSTSNLVFSTPEIVSYLSKFMTLEPGDVIATGTPPGKHIWIDRQGCLAFAYICPLGSGVGCFRKPQLWLKTGSSHALVIRMFIIFESFQHCCNWDT